MRALGDWLCFPSPMATAQLAALVRHCDTLLRTAEVNDWDRAHNGLQVENDGRVTRIAAAVDTSLATVKLAIAAKADLLIVHHGLFWSDTVPWTGKRRELQRLLIEHNLAIYSSHLPLDLHPKLGNNAQLASRFGWLPDGRFGEQDIAWLGTVEAPTTAGPRRPYRLTGNRLACGSRRRRRTCRAAMPGGPRSATPGSTR